MTKRIILGFLIAVMTSAPGLAAATDLKIWTPTVEEDAWTVEAVGDAGFDSRRLRSGEQSQAPEIGYGLTSWWQTEVQLGISREPGPAKPTGVDQVNWENLLLLTEPGQYWLDAGLIAEFGQALHRRNPDEATLGPTLRGAFGGTTTTVNLLVEKDFGETAPTKPIFLYRWETRIDAWRLHLGSSAQIEPGVQIYGEPGPIGHFTALAAQDERAGPQLFGKIVDVGPGEIEWNGGVLFGLTPLGPRETVRWQAEYQIDF